MTEAQKNRKMTLIFIAIRIIGISLFAADQAYQHNYDCIAIFAAAFIAILAYMLIWHDYEPAEGEAFLRIEKGKVYTISDKD